MPQLAIAAHFTAPAEFSSPLELFDSASKQFNNLFRKILIVGAIWGFGRGLGWRFLRGFGGESSRGRGHGLRSSRAHSDNTLGVSGDTATLLARPWPRQRL